jgi:hypothetical protein
MDLSDPVFDSKAMDVFLVLAVAEGNELALLRYALTNGGRATFRN